MESVVNAHDCASVNTSDPLDIPSQEGVAAPWERLESDPLASLVDTWVKEGALVIFCQLSQLTVILIIVWAKKECFQKVQIDYVCIGARHKVIFFVQLILRVQAFHTIGAQLELAFDIHLAPLFCRIK